MTARHFFETATVRDEFIFLVALSILVSTFIKYVPIQIRRCDFATTSKIRYLKVYYQKIEQFCAIQSTVKRFKKNLTQPAIRQIGNGGERFLKRSSR